MTWKTTSTEAAGATAADPDLPPAPRGWPHIARRPRPASAVDHPSRPLPAWPRRTTAQPPRDIYRGRGAGRCTDRPRGTATVSVDDSGARRDPEPGRTAGRHRASPQAPSGERAGSGAPSAPGPSDLARRARRYERRMAQRPAESRADGHTRTGSQRLDGAQGSQRTTPIRTTRFPTIRPRSTPFPGAEPARHTPDRHLPRSPGRNPVRRPDTDGRHLPISGMPRHRSGRPGPTSRHRRPANLIGAALTTVFLAIPLGPGPTAAAHSGDATAVAHPGTAGGPSTTGTGLANTGPITLQAGHIPASLRNSDSSPSAEVPGSASAALGAVGTGTPESPAVSSTATPVDAPPGLPVGAETLPAEPDAGQSNEVARRSPAGSSRAGGCGAGSNSGSATGSGALCRVLPLLEDLVHELLRLAPRPVPQACPCPDPGR